MTQRPRAISPMALCAMSHFEGHASVFKRTHEALQKHLSFVSRHDQLRAQSDGVTEAAHRFHDGGSTKACKPLKKAGQSRPSVFCCEPRVLHYRLIALPG